MSGHTVSYLFTDLMSGEVLAELPLTGVTFSLALNAAGQWSGTLPVEDQRIANLNWREATNPAKTAMWVVVDPNGVGTLVYGGIVWTRNYDREKGAVTLGGSDHWSYLAHRIQAKDYSNQWATTPTDAVTIAETIINDALSTAFSAPINVATEYSQANPNPVPLSAPLSQRQSIDSIVAMLQPMGWLVGFDLATDVGWNGGTPEATITLSYPRRGRIAGSTGLVLDTTDALAMTWPEDGTKCANAVYEFGSGSGGVQVGGIWNPSTTEDGYPVLEVVASHPSMSSTPLADSVMEATTKGDLSLYAYPPATPTITIPAFGTPALGDYIVGDDARVIVPEVSGLGMTPDPRFPGGLDFYLRINKVDVAIADQGISTAKLSLGVPPSSSPIQAPL